MPAINPFLDAADGGGVVYSPSVEALIQQDPRPGAIAGHAPMNTATASQINAAGTSENVNQHVAILVALLALGVFGLSKAGFRFAGTGSVGFGR